MDAGRNPRSEIEVTSVKVKSGNESMDMEGQGKVAKTELIEMSGI